MTAPTTPAGPAPLRRTGSVRRTSSIDSHWPDGRGGPVCLRGHARDLLTPADGSPPRVVTEDRIAVTITPGREILAIATEPPRSAVAGLVGVRAGGHLRAALDHHLPDERAAGTPLYLLLDDLSGASLVAGWAWSRWVADWHAQAPPEARATAGRNGRMEGVCVGFRPGSSALNDDGTASAERQSSTPVPPLPHPDDPLGWHPLPDQAGVGMRRARRIDVWRADGLIHIDAGFQDSATSPATVTGGGRGGGRVAVHEYALSATADPASGRLLSVAADPRILPYPECPAAAGNIGRLVGVPLSALRLTVLEALRGTAGCTHLNDALRALAEVPRLVAALDS